MIARHVKDFTWNRGWNSNSPPPARLWWLNSLLPGTAKVSNARGIPGGAGHVEASIWPIHNHNQRGPNSSFSPYSPKLPLFKERRDELSLYSTFSPHSPFAKGFAMSFEFLLRLWRVFAIFDIFAVFAKYTIFVKIAPHAFAIFAIAGWFSLLSSY